MSKKMYTGSINLTKIDKDVLFKSEKTGNIYLNIVIFVDDEELDQYENNGAIAQSYPKEKKPESNNYLGNVRLYVPKDDAADVVEADILDVGDLPF